MDLGCSARSGISGAPKRGQRSAALLGTLLLTPEWRRVVGEYAMESVQSLGGQEASPNSKAPLIMRGPSRQEWTRTQHASYQECSNADAVNRRLRTPWWST
jgi:hypothetical protein